MWHEAALGGLFEHSGSVSLTNEIRGQGTLFVVQHAHFSLERSDLLQIDTVFTQESIDRLTSTVAAIF